MRAVLLATGLSLAVIGAAAAQSGNGGRETAAASRPDIGQQVENQLRQAGFTDVTVGQRSLLVRAKDGQGRDVTMVVDAGSAARPTGGFGARETTGMGTPNLPESTSDYEALPPPPPPVCHLLPLAGDRCS